MRLWVWRNFRIRLPEDWEMLTFSRKSAAGSCAFADRYRYRAELSWKRFSCGPGGRPDIRRLMSDYCAKLKLEDQMPDAQPCQVDSWRGLVGHIGGKTRSVGPAASSGRSSRSTSRPDDQERPARNGLAFQGPPGAAGLRHGEVAPPSEPGKTLTTRFGAYYTGESCLVELVFTWPDGRDRRLEKRVLKSVKEEVTAANGYRRWKAFGMDMLVSGGLELEECKVEPASATMVFVRARHAVPLRGTPTGARKERFQRLGMLGAWLRTSVGEWLERSVPPGAWREMKETVRTSEVVAGHRIERVRGLTAATGIAKLGEIFTGRRNVLEAAAWICPVDGRLYFSRIEGRAPWTGGRLSCCADLRDGVAASPAEPRPAEPGPKGRAVPGR